MSTDVRQRRSLRGSRRLRSRERSSSLSVPAATLHGSSAATLQVQLPATADVPVLDASSPVLPGWPSEGMARLGMQELRRRMIHIAPGFLPFVLWYFPHDDPLSGILTTIMVALAISISGWVWWKQPSFLRRGEQGANSAILGYGGFVLGLLLLVPSAPELGLSVLGILAFGDGTATLVGLVVGGTRLPWNPAKSWAGLIAFVSASIPISALIYCGEAQPRIGYDQALACVAPAAMLAALAESIPSRINDNIRVGLAGAVTILITHAMFVGC